MFWSNVMQDESSRAECARNGRFFSTLAEDIRAVCPEALYTSAEEAALPSPAHHVARLDKVIAAMEDPNFAVAVALHSLITARGANAYDEDLSDEALGVYASQLAKHWLLARQYMYLQTAVQVLWPALEEPNAQTVNVFLGHVDAVAQRLALLAGSGEFRDDSIALFKVADNIALQARLMREAPMDDASVLRSHVLAISNVSHPLMEGPVMNIRQRLNA